MGLLHLSDSQDLYSSFGLQSDETEVLLAVGVQLFDSVQSLSMGGLCWCKRKTLCLMPVELGT